MSDRVISFRASPTDKSLLELAMMEEARRAGLPYPTQSATIRAALFHFWSGSTPKQRAVAWEVTRGVRGPMDIGEDADAWEQRRRAAELALEKEERDAE